jgi:hypothetical protein
MRDQTVQLRPRQNGNVKAGASFDRLLERRREPEFDLDSRGLRALEARDEFDHQRPHGTATEDFEVVG